jgi:hypothetical protein
LRDRGERIHAHGGDGRQLGKPHATQAPCPSSEWWSNDAGAEEREVAFVACSRAKKTLVLAVHQGTFEALRGSQPEFVRLFEVRELEKGACGKSPRRKRARRDAVVG